MSRPEGGAPPSDSELIGKLGRIRPKISCSKRSKMDEWKALEAGLAPQFALPLHGGETLKAWNAGPADGGLLASVGR